MINAKIPKTNLIVKNFLYFSYSSWHNRIKIKPHRIIMVIINLIITGREVNANPKMAFGTVTKTKHNHIKRPELIREN